MCQGAEGRLLRGHRGSAVARQHFPLSVSAAAPLPAVACIVNRICAPVSASIRSTDCASSDSLLKLYSSASSRTVGNASTAGESGADFLESRLHPCLLQCPSIQSGGCVITLRELHRIRGPQNLPAPVRRSPRRFSHPQIASSPPTTAAHRQGSRAARSSHRTAAAPIPAPPAAQPPPSPPAASADPPAANAHRDPPAPSPAASRPSPHNPAAAATPSPSVPAPTAERPASGEPNSASRFSGNMRNGV